ALPISCRSRAPRASPVNEFARHFCLQARAVEHPGTVGQWVLGFDLSTLGCDPQRLWAETKELGRLCQVHPSFRFVRVGPMDRNLMVASERCHPLTGPTVAVTGAQVVAIEQTRDQIIAADTHELPYCFNDLLRRAIALSPAPSRQAELGVDAAHPVDNENDLSDLRIRVGDHLPDQRSHDALLQTDVARRVLPDRS